MWLKVVTYPCDIMPRSDKSCYNRIEAILAFQAKVPDNIPDTARLDQQQSAAQMLANRNMYRPSEDLPPKAPGPGDEWPPPKRRRQA